MKIKILALLAAVALLGSMLFSGCGGGGVFGTGDERSFPEVPMITVKGTLYSDGLLAPSLAPLAAASTSEVAAVVDAGGVAIEKSLVVMSGTNFTAMFPAESIAGRHAVIVFKKNGKDFFQKFVGRIPTASEIPAGITVSGVIVDHASTVRSLILRTNKVKAPATPVSVRDVSLGATWYDDEVDWVMNAITDVQTRENELRKALLTVASALSASPEAAGRMQTRLSTLDDLVTSYSAVMTEKNSNAAVNTVVAAGSMTAADFQNYVLAFKTSVNTIQKTSVPYFTPDPFARTYTSVQSVVIAGATGATIRYTTDGSIPDKSNVGKTYTAPLSVKATTKFIARSFITGAIPSDPVTATYAFATSSKDAAGTDESEIR